MQHVILFLGKVKTSFIQTGVAEYQKRLLHYTSLLIRTQKDPGAGKTGPVVKQLQGAALLASAPAGAVKVVLDSSGKQFTSERFAAQLTRWENSGVRTVAWLIGGPEGHDAEVVRRADLLLSFSEMTFTHDLVRLLLLEQLYRAYTIKAGERYHK